MPPDETVVPLATPPLSTTSRPAEDTTLPLATPPEETTPNPPPPPPPAKAPRQHFAAPPQRRLTGDAAGAADQAAALSHHDANRQAPGVDIHPAAGGDRHAAGDTANGDIGRAAEAERAA